MLATYQTIAKVSLINVQVPSEMHPLQTRTTGQVRSTDLLTVQTWQGHCVNLQPLM